MKRIRRKNPLCLCRVLCVQCSHNFSCLFFWNAYESRKKVLFIGYYFGICWKLFDTIRKRFLSFLLFCSPVQDVKKPVLKKNFPQRMLSFLSLLLPAIKTTLDNFAVTLPHDLKSQFKLNLGNLT